MEFGVRTQRRMLRRALGAAVTLIVGAAVAGCATPAPKPSPTPTAIFSSEEEALATATDTYQQYTAALDAVFANGGADDASLAPWVTPDYLEKLSEDGILESNEWHTEGSTTFDTVALSDLEEDTDVTVTLTLCRDVSGVRFHDLNNVDVTPADRTERFPVEVSFVSSEDSAKELLIAESDSWTGEDFC